MEYFITVVLWFSVVESRAVFDNGLEASIEKLDIDTFDHEYYSARSYGRSDMFNDSMTFAEAYWYQTKEFPKSGTQMAQADIFKFLTSSNQWIKIFDVKNLPLCHFLRTNLFAKYALTFSNVDSVNCPTPIGDWWVKEFVFDNKLLPPGMPAPSKWKAVILLSFGKKPVLQYTLLAEVQKRED